MAHPEWEIDTFVTLGSPLGASMLVQTMVHHDEDGAPSLARLGQALGQHRRRRRPRLRRTPALDQVFGDRVVDRLVDNGHRAHDPQPYMNNRTTGSVLAEAIARSR